MNGVKSIARWGNGTCIECKPQRIGENPTEFFVFSFFKDIMYVEVGLKNTG